MYHLVIVFLYTSVYWCSLVSCPGSTDVNYLVANSGTAEKLRTALVQ